MERRTFGWRFRVLAYTAVAAGTVLAASARASARQRQVTVVAPLAGEKWWGGGEATTYRPGGFFSEKLFVRSCALAALHPMMQFSAAPWRYLSPENVGICRAFANLHVDFAPYILDLARHAARTGEPIVRTMEYEFPHAGFAKPMTQFMLGPKWLVAPVTAEDDAVTVELPAGRWTDDLGVAHVGPKTLTLTHVPLGRLPRYVRTETTK